MVYENIIQHIPIIGNMNRELNDLFERALSLDINGMEQLFTKERDTRYEADIIDKMINNREYGGDSGVPADPELSVVCSGPMVKEIKSLRRSFEWKVQNNEIKCNNVEEYYQKLKNNFEIYDDRRSRQYKECRNVDFCGIFNFLRALYYRLVNLDEHRIIYNYLINKLDEIERS